MILDSKQQKSIILQLIESATFTGKSLKEMSKFQEVVEAAEIAGEEEKDARDAQE